MTTDRETGSTSETADDRESPLAGPAGRWFATTSRRPSGASDDGPVLPRQPPSTLLQMTKKRTDQKDSGEPALSPDGRYLYFSDDVTPGETFGRSS